MNCPYCGGDDIDLVSSGGEDTPVARCPKCGAELDPLALAAQQPTRRVRPGGARVLGGILGVLLLLGVLFAFARPLLHSRTDPRREISRSVLAPSATVYVTRTGMKFHRADCRYLREGADRMRRDEAKRSGFSPCSVCRP